MRAFTCDNCGQLVFFENTACLNCGAELGFDWREREMLLVGERSRCANLKLAGCNWETEEPADLCFACNLTRTRPADGDLDGLREFRVAEKAKRWLLFELGELGLPVEGWQEREGGLAFDMLSSSAEPVMTGHANGVITLDLAESDDANRVARREQLAEPYRTVLGHLRHEIGHYYWPILVDSPAPLTRSRELFGDESADYEAAVKRHYASGPPADWADRHVSAYATMHPSEDWAETFAHYLHIRDGLQTAAAYRVRVLGPPDAPPPRLVNQLAARPLPDEHDFDRLLSDWLPLTYALNAINRSIGRSRLYPFVLSPPVIEKLAFVHELVEA